MVSNGNEYITEKGWAFSALRAMALHERVAGILLNRANPEAEWFHRWEIEDILRDHAEGRRDHRKRLWSLYCLFRFASGARA